MIHHIDGNPFNNDPANLIEVTSVHGGYWGFGTVVRVDPAKNPKVRQPDDRRWMVLVPANTSANRQWTLLFLGPALPGCLVPFSSMYGFERVDE